MKFLYNSFISNLLIEFLIAIMKSQDTNRHKYILHLSQGEFIKSI